MNNDNEEPERNTTFLVNFLPVLLLLVGLATVGFIMMLPQILYETTFTLTENDFIALIFSMIVTLMLSLFVYFKLKRRKDESKDDLKEILIQMKGE